MKLTAATVERFRGLPRTIKMDGPLGITCPECESPPGHSCYSRKAVEYPRRMKRFHGSRRGVVGSVALLGKPFGQI